MSPKTSKPASKGATALGTREYYEKVSVPREINHGPRVFGKTDWMASALGFGCYRVGTTHPDHRKSLISALKHGVNVIDTSTNYTDGDSERLVGSCLEQGISEGWLRREEVIVVSKVGYVQASNLTEAKERVVAGKAYPEMVEYTDDCWHCIHPDYLEEQLEKTRRRLGLECVDVYLLHNPEYFLSAAQHQKQRPDTETLRQEFYRRIEAAFKFLEKACQQGRIQYYGVSSNSLGKLADDPESTSIESFLEAATRAAGGGESHFAVVQLPLNVFESQPVLNKLPSDADKNTLEFAKSHGISVLVNRPLNAFFNGQLVRLADYPKGVIAHPFKQCISNVEDLEEEFRNRFAPQLEMGDASAEELFTWGKELAHVPETHIGVEHWNQIDHQVRWQTRGLFQAIEEQTKLEGWEEWHERYARRLEELLQCCLAVARQTSNETGRKIAEHLAPHIPSSYADSSLSQKELGLLMSTDGVTTVLVGMRRPEYVTDSIDALKLEYVVNPENAYSAFAKGS